MWLLVLRSCQQEVSSVLFWTLKNGILLLRRGVVEGLFLFRFIIIIIIIIIFNTNAT